MLPHPGIKRPVHLGFVFAIALRLNLLTQIEQSLLLLYLLLTGLHTHRAHAQVQFIIAAEARLLLLQTLLGSRMTAAKQVGTRLLSYLY